MINGGEIPLLKADIMKAFGYISYQLIFANIDAVGAYLKSSGEVVVITYRGKNKVGFIYDEGSLSEERVLEIYRDFPNNRNDLEEHEKKEADKLEILIMPKNNYVFVNDKEVKPIKK